MPKKRLESNDLGITYRPQPEDRLDVGVFEACLPGDASIEAMLQAVSAYRGDLLPGFYEDWVSLERERLKAAFENKMGMLLEALLAEKRWSEILEWGERWIALGSTPEPAYRALMVAHTGLGNLPAAAAIYQRCIEALDRELGVEPSDMTRKVYAQISEKSAESISLKGEMSQLQIPAFLREPEKLVPVFVCRQTELAVLDEYLRRALNGRLQVVFVSGEAGSGKTFLLHEFLRRSLSTFPEIVTGVGICNAFFGQGVPYLPFRDILNMLAGGIEPLYINGTITRGQAVQLLEAFPLVFRILMQKSPGLINSFFSAAALADRAFTILPTEEHLKQRIDKLAVQAGNLLDEQEKPQLFEQYVQLLGDIAVQRPLLLILDDLQWMDPGTGRLLFHIFRRLQNSRILIAGAFRREEVDVSREGERHPLEVLLHEFQSSCGRITVDLDENSEDSGREFINALLDSEPNRLDEPFRRELYRHTQGHALFTIQLLRNMQEKKEILPDKQGRWITSSDLDWQNLPAQIEGVIGERIGHLDHELQNLLLTASVEGEQFTLQVLERIHGKGKGEILPRLSRELEKRHHLVQEEGSITVGGQRLVKFRFVHTLIQRYLYQQLGAAECAMLHQQIAENLEILYKNDLSSITVALAHHYQKAGDLEKAAIYFGLAGDQARSIYAHQQAISLYQQAMDFFKESGAVDQVARTLMKLYLVYHNSFDYSLAQQTLKQYNILTRKLADRKKVLIPSSEKNLYRLSVLKKPLLDPGLADSLFDQELIKELFLRFWRSGRKIGT